MHRRRSPLLLVVASGALLLGCSDGSEVTERSESPARPESSAGADRPTSSTPSTTAGDDPAPATQDGPLCAAAQRIRDLDDRSNEIMNDAMRASIGDPGQAVEELADAVAELGPLIPELTAAYDDLSEAAPDAIGDDITLVRDFTLSLMEQLSELDSADDLAAFEQQVDTNAAMAAGAAALEIDAVTQEQCGISIAG
jgi:hypothetical protein